ncbi:MAG: helix-turn-helix domain-containing protein [Polyangiaceae bacterium]
MEGAIHEATLAIALAVEHGYRVREAEARQALCDALLVAGRVSALASAAAELTSVAALLGVARFTRAAALYRALAADGGPDPAILEAIAAAEPALDAGVRARALLGAPGGDALDRAVLDAFRARSGFHAPELVTSHAPPSRWVAGWGVDEARSRVWLSDGASVDLSRHPVQWALLGRLAARGGAATKEELVVDVWRERDYHPLRHDNRLQAAVRKLRIQIEDDPANPTRFVTTPDGYALAGAARRLRARQF